ncbi:MAG: hypothetical protein FWG99_05095 [Treponema sp.]|nr:hypothetical protein [Treponema sp.]
MQSNSFNELYKLYSDGEIERQEFEGAIHSAIADKKHSYNTNNLTDDELNDFISWLYPRIRSAVDSYKNTGSSFDAYIASMIKLSAKEYHVRSASKNITEYAVWNARVPEMYTHQEEPHYIIEKIEETAEPEKSTDKNDLSVDFKNPRQLLILILKCYCYVSEDFLDRAAPRVGVPREKLQEMTDKLRIIRARRDQELRDMRERVYCQFYRCMVYEKKLTFLSENNIARLRMKEKLEKARTRLELMRKRLAGIRPTATNSQIAEVIGISKGAVDASYYNLRARWKNMADNALLN